MLSAAGNRDSRAGQRIERFQHTVQPKLYSRVGAAAADHGNADQMTETKKGKTSIRTAHSLNPVPFIIYDPDQKWTIKDGKYGLANVAPTIVKMMGFQAPDCWEESMI